LWGVSGSVGVWGLFQPSSCLGSSEPVDWGLPGSGAEMRDDFAKSSQMCLGAVSSCPTLQMWDGWMDNKKRVVGPHSYQLGWAIYIYTYIYIYMFG